MVKSARLMQLVNLFDKKMKWRYYEVCGVVEKKLLAAGYQRLNDDQCRYICQHLQLEKKMTMGDLKKMSSGPAVRPPEQPESQHRLFD